MNSRICRCCGEPMLERGNSLSRNPNICASCSSMSDGLEDPIVPERVRVAHSQELRPQRVEIIGRGWAKRRTSDREVVPANSRQYQFSNTQRW